MQHSFAVVNNREVIYEGGKVPCNIGMSRSSQQFSEIKIPQAIKESAARSMKMHQGPVSNLEKMLMTSIEDQIHESLSMLRIHVFRRHRTVQDALRKFNTRPGCPRNVQINISYFTEHIAHQVITSSQLDAYTNGNY
ncbi:Uncharacterised protein at_DN2239 [Pycnogonum litorale]